MKRLGATSGKLPEVVDRAAAKEKIRFIKVDSPEGPRIRCTQGHSGAAAKQISNAEYMDEYTSRQPESRKRNDFSSKSKRIGIYYET